MNAQFLLVASPSTRFWAPCDLSANLICKVTIVEKWLSLRQTRQLAVHVRLFLRSLIYSATALICLSASDIFPEGSALSSLSEEHLCCLYLLHKISRLLAEMPFSFQPSKPGTLCAGGGGVCPWEYISWVLVPGPWPPDVFCHLFYLGVGLFSAGQTMHLSIFLTERKNFNCF